MNQSLKQAANQEERVDILSLVRMMRRQSKLILAVVLFNMAFMLAYLMIVPPQFKSTALVFADTSQKELLSGAQRPMVSSVNEQARVDSEIEIMRSDRVFYLVAEQMMLDDDPEFGLHVGRIQGALIWLGVGSRPEQGSIGALDQSVIRLRDAVKIQRQGLTYVAKVTTSSNDPAKAAAISNTLAATYIELQAQAKTASAAAARDALRPLLEQAREEMLDAQTRFDLQQDTSADSLRMREQTYVQMLESIQQLEAKALAQIADSRIISAARIPSYSYKPNRALLLLLAFTNSLLFATALAYLKEQIFDGVVSIGQLGRILQVPSLGAVRHAETPAHKRSVADLMHADPMSPYSEAIRNLRVAIDQEGKWSEGIAKVVMVSSPDVGEGKSITALSLARAYAMGGRRTLLIDANFRTPSLHQLIGFRPESGLTDYLENPENVEDAKPFYIADPLSNCGVMLGQEAASTPTDQLLASDRFAHLITQARNNFDVVIIDTSAILPSADARYVAPHVDMILLLAKFQSTRQAKLREAYHRIKVAKSGQANIVGVLTFTQ